MKKIAKRNLLERYKKVQFPQSSVDTWNGLKEEVLMAKNVHQLKEKLDKWSMNEKLEKYRYGDRTT